MKIPVLPVIFRRPDLTARVMEVLRRLKPPRPYVAADAARPGRDEDGLCTEARTIAEAVDWPWKHPATIKRDIWLEERLWRKLYRPNTLPQRMRRKVLRTRQILT
jgi:hypothetical protein